MARPTFFYLLTTLCVFIFLTTFSTSVFGEYTITKITSTNTTEYRCLPTVGDPPVNGSITEPWQWNVAGGRQQIVLSLDNAHRKPYNGGDCLWNISQTALLNPPTPLEASYGAWQPNSLHLDLGALVFGPVFENEQPDRLTVIGYAYVVEDDMGKEVIGHRETVLYRSSGSNSRDGGLSGSGLLLNLAGYHSVLVSLSLGFMCSDKVPDRRNFRATFLWNAPVTLQDGVGAMTFPLPESWLPERHDNFKATVEFFPATADHLILLNFTSLPVNTTVTTTSRNATTTTTSVSNSISVDSLPLDPLRTVFLQSSDKPGITISVDLPRPLERLISFRYWQVRKDCSMTVQLRVGQPAQAISVPDRQTNESSVALRCAVFYTTTEPGDKLLLSTPGPSSLANMADQLYLYDPQGQPVLGLNNLANAHFSALDTISETNSAVVLYESPYLSPPNVDFQLPQIKAIPTQASKITLTNDTPVKVTFSPEDKTVHLVFSEEDFFSNVVLGFPSTSEKHSTKPEFTSVKINSDNPTSSSSSASIAPLLQYAHQITLTKGSL